MLRDLVYTLNTTQRFYFLIINGYRSNVFIRFRTRHVSSFVARLPHVIWLITQIWCLINLEEVNECIHSQTAFAQHMEYFKIIIIIIKSYSIKIIIETPYEDTVIVVDHPHTNNYCQVKEYINFLTPNALVIRQLFLEDDFVQTNLKLIIVLDNVKVTIATVNLSLVWQLNHSLPRLYQICYVN